MSGNLQIYAELEKPVAVKKDADDENTKRFKKIERIPEDVGMGSLELPFDKRAYAIVDGVPKAEPQVGTLPGIRNIVYEFQAR